MEEVKNKKIDITVLYVEDDTFTGETVEMMMKRRVERIVWAKNGKEGLEMYREIKPDIVITDGTMPVMSGFEMTKEIRQSDKEIPIICTSAHEEKEFIEKMKEAGINEIILKPIDKVKVMEIIKHYFADKI